MHDVANGPSLMWCMNHPAEEVFIGVVNIIMMRIVDDDGNGENK